MARRRSKAKEKKVALYAVVDRKSVEELSQVLSGTRPRCSKRAENILFGVYTQQLAVTAAERPGTAFVQLASMDVSKAIAAAASGRKLRIEQRAMATAFVEAAAKRYFTPLKPMDEARAVALGAAGPRHAPTPQPATVKRIRVVPGGAVESSRRKH